MELNTSNYKCLIWNGFPKSGHKCLNESKSIQSWITHGKKENLYELILAYKWMNLLAVLLVKEGESSRMWECGITTRLLITLKSIIKVSTEIYLVDIHT